MIMEESEKETYPTIMESSNNSDNNEGKETEEDRLQQQYSLLQREWDDYIKTRAIDTTFRRRSSSCCSTDSRIIVKALEELLLLNHENISPRALMSSLQRSPWKLVRNNNMAVEEILRERRADIESGRLKGRRRLFGDDDEEEEMACSGLDGLVVEDSSSDQEMELGLCYEYCDDRSKKGFGHNESFLSSQPSVSSSSRSSSSSSSFICDECLERQMGEEDDDGGEKVDVSADHGGGSDQERRRKKVVRVQVSLGLILFVIGIISTSIFSSFYRGENAKVFLVPT